jgi:hypothetical protein
MCCSLMVVRAQDDILGSDQATDQDYLSQKKTEANP